MAPCVTWRGDDQFKEIRARLRTVPADHDRSDRAAALRYTREQDVVTTGVLFEVTHPSLLDELRQIQQTAQSRSTVRTPADIFRTFYPDL